VSDNPAVVLFDVNGNPMAVSGGMSLPTGTIGLMMAAVDSNGFVRFVSTISGSLQVTGSVIAQVTFPQNQQVWQAGTVGVSGAVALTNWPAVVGVTASAPIQVWSEGTVGVSGTVNVGNFPANQQVWQSGPVGVSGTVSVTQPVMVYSSGALGVSGSVAITNWPVTVGVSGSVGVTNFPATQNVSGTVIVTQTGSFHVTVDNPTPPPANQQVWQVGPVGVTGSVNTYTSGPQAVSGSVGVTNFPATQNVSGTVVVTQTGSFHVTVDNSELAISNFPAVQAVSGSVNVYTSGLQGVSGTVQVWSEGPLPISGTASTPVWVTTTGSLPALAIGLSEFGQQVPLRPDPVGNLYVVPTASSITSASLSKGFVRATASATAIPIRATTYTEQSNNAQRSFKSTSANDASGNTGAVKVEVVYYDINLNGPFTETVTLNGTTAVNTVNTNICYIETLVVTSVGSNGSNVGTINMYTTTGGGGSIFASIGVGTLVSGAGDNQTLWCHHYVGKMLTSSISSMTCGTNGNQTAEVFIKNKDMTSGSTAPELLLSEIMTVAQGATSIVRLYQYELKTFGPARIVMYVDANGANTNFYGSFNWQERDHV
jgi:hypothetical protein